MNNVRICLIAICRTGFVHGNVYSNYLRKAKITAIVDHVKMIKACSYAKVKLQIAFMRRFDLGFAHAKKIIDEGTICKPVIIKSLTIRPDLPRKFTFNTIKYLELAASKKVYFKNLISKKFKFQDLGKVLATAVLPDTLKVLFINKLILTI